MTLLQQLSHELNTLEGIVARGGVHAAIAESIERIRAVVAAMRRVEG